MLDRHREEHPRYGIAGSVGVAECKVKRFGRRGSKLELEDFEPVNEAPEEGRVKLNSDGASNDRNRDGCGGLIHNSKGGFHRGHRTSLGRCNVFCAELWGVLEGLKLIRKFN
ncbi:hypothetical protein KIW84_041830 [Lathyrus oleraceus]|uniref:RNase H type-1 domain-containing protein n=1 Tax=Pisum sativum TaxID=3888 RepID=A0A9D5ARR3_PEA|nr:hypothetical protein KIW84_041830 [Pisum sativum]